MLTTQFGFWGSVCISQKGMHAIKAKSTEQDNLSDEENNQNTL